MKTTTTTNEAKETTPQATGAVRFQRYGGPEVLRWAQVPLPPPGPGEARVRHTAVGLNFIDTYHRTGLYPVPALPSGLGVEAAGVVEALGPGAAEVAPELKVGTRVAYAAGPPGAYAEARNMVAERLGPLPPAAQGITDEVAAASLLKGMTVAYLIRQTYPVRVGQTVLWHAAAGGVGLLACQWLKHLGVTVVGTVGSPEKAALARANGCAHTILYRDEDVAARVRELTGGVGVPVVFDSVGAATFEASLDCLQPRGTMVSFGNASGAVPPFAPALLAQKGSLFLTRPTLFAYTATRAELLETAGALFQVLQAGAVEVHVGQRWPLREAAEAHRALEARETTGATVLKP